MTRAEQILQNTIDAMRDRKVPTPQPYGKIVAKAYTEQDIASDQLLEIVAFLLEAATELEPAE